MSNQREVISKNLKKLIASKGIDQRILADHLNLSEMSVSHWVNGTKYPRMGNIQKMADYFGVMKSDIIEDKDNQPVMTTSNYNYFPTAISAGLPITVDGITNAEKITVPDSVMGKWAGDKDIFFTKIFGDSMDKIIPDGSLIAVKPTPLENLKDGDMVVFNDNYDYSVKCFYKDDDRLIFSPESRNRKHTDQIFTTSDNITINGKVVLYIVEMD